MTAEKKPKKPTSKGSKLSPKQERFCEEYMLDLNASEAAVRAGFSRRSRQQLGHLMLQDPRIAERITELKRKASERLEISADNVIQEIASVAFSNIKDFLTSENTIRSINDLPRNLTRAVSSVEVTETFISNGKDLPPTKEITTKLKLHPKVPAMEQLARHLGLFKKDNEQHPNEVLFKIYQGIDPSKV